MSETGNYIGTHWRDKTFSSYKIKVLTQSGSTALPTVPGDTLLTVEANVGLPRVFPLTVSALSAGYDLDTDKGPTKPETTPHEDPTGPRRPPSNIR